MIDVFSQIQPRSMPQAYIVVPLLTTINSLLYTNNFGYMIVFLMAFFLGG